MRWRTAVASLGAAVALAAPPWAAAAPWACEQIRAACRQAGFVEGRAAAGIGVELDCFAPVLSGGHQPPSARRPLPQVAPAFVAACRRARNAGPAAATSGAAVGPANGVQTRDSDGNRIANPP